MAAKVNCTYHHLNSNNANSSTPPISQVPLNVFPLHPLPIELNQLMRFKLTVYIKYRIQTYQRRIYTNGAMRYCGYLHN